MRLDKYLWTLDKYTRNHSQCAQISLTSWTWYPDSLITVFLSCCACFFLFLYCFWCLVSSFMYVFEIFVRRILLIIFLLVHHLYKLFSISCFGVKGISLSPRSNSKTPPEPKWLVSDCDGVGKRSVVVKASSKKRFMVNLTQSFQ